MIDNAIRRCVDEAAAHHGLSPEEIIARNQTPHVVDARRTACRLARQSGVTVEKMSKFFGLDVTTIRKYLAAEGMTYYPQQPEQVQVPRPRRPVPKILPAEWQRTPIERMHAMAQAENAAMQERDGI
jgi:hypothetical protein